MMNMTSKSDRAATLCGQTTEDDAPTAEDVAGDLERHSYQLHSRRSASPLWRLVLRLGYDPRDVPPATRSQNTWIAHLVEQMGKYHLVSMGRPGWEDYARRCARVALELADRGVEGRHADELRALAAELREQASNGRRG
jgi:hypothetical protein